MWRYIHIAEVTGRMNRPVNVCKNLVQNQGVEVRYWTVPRFLHQISLQWQNSNHVSCFIIHCKYKNCKTIIVKLMNHCGRKDLLNGRSTVTVCTLLCNLKQVLPHYFLTTSVLPNIIQSVRQISIHMWTHLLASLAGVSDKVIFLYKQFRASLIRCYIKDLCTLLCSALFLIREFMVL